MAKYAIRTRGIALLERQEAIYLRTIELHTQVIEAHKRKRNLEKAVVYAARKLRKALAGPTRGNSVKVLADEYRDALTANRRLVIK